MVVWKLLWECCALFLSSLNLVFLPESNLNKLFWLFVLSSWFQLCQTELCCFILGLTLGVWALLETERCQEDAVLLLRNLKKISLVLLCTSTWGVSVETSLSWLGHHTIGCGIPPPVLSRVVGLLRPTVSIQCFSQLWIMALILWQLPEKTRKALVFSGSEKARENNCIVPFLWEIKVLVMQGV